MKKIIISFPFSIFHLFLIFFAVSCGSPQPVVDMHIPDIDVPDSLWTPTGDSQLDSLLQLASVAPQDTSLAQLYNEIGDIYESCDFELAKEYYLKLGNLSENLHWSEGYYAYAASYSNVLAREGSCDSALVIIQQAYDMAIRENDETWMAHMIFNKGNTYLLQQWYTSALECYFEALPVYEKNKDIEKLSHLYYMMAQLYRDIYNIEKAIEYGEKSVALNNKDPFAYLALGLAYATAHNYEKANTYYEKALLLNESNYNDYLQGLLYYFIASSAFSSYDIDKAEKYIHLALEINRPFGPPNYYSDLILLSKVEQVKGNSKEAEKHAKEALQIAIELETLEEQKYCYSILSELAIAKGNHLESIKYWEECDLVEIAIATNLTLHATEEMAVKYETAKKEFEIEQQKTIIKNQNLQRIFLASGIVVCILMLVLLLFLLRLRTRRNSELAEMNLTKDKFFNIISHDLKSPAVAQRNALQVLVKNARTWDFDTLEDYYEELLKSAEGQVELLLNLLNWSQLQTGRIAYNPEIFAISELSTSFSLICNMAENKGITFNIQMPENAIITCDSKMLITIIRNLLVNAVKFTATGGRITLDISPCRRDVASNVSSKYTVSVSDTGVGMSEMHLNTLFNLESAHSHSGTAGEQGTGLGLIICKELVKKLGSKLHVDSVEGVGSKFWFNV